MSNDDGDVLWKRGKRCPIQNQVLQATLCFLLEDAKIECNVPEYLMAEESK